jgi:ABC-2 type transport system permease protein
MRFGALFRKTALENVRDWKILGMTLLFAPFFVILMYFYLTGASQTFVLLVVNHDTGLTDGNITFNAGDELIAVMMNTSYSDGGDILDVRAETDVIKAKNSLIDKTADLLVEIPRDFSSSLAAYRDGAGQQPAIVRTTGDPSSQKYIMAASYSDLLTYTYASEVTGAGEPVTVDMQTIGDQSTEKATNTFDQMVPGLLVLSLMMLMFTAAASIIREKDKGTITRLLMSRMGAFDFLASVSLAQILIGIAAVGLTFLTALALGCHSHGSLVAVLVICVLCTLAIIAISLIVAAFLRSIFDLMTIGCFPFFVLMFFSGGMFPLPNLQVLTIAGHAINVNDVLPTTPAINAMGKVLNYGTGLDGLGFELTLLALLTVAYFAAGLWLFRRKYLRRG